MLEVTRAVTESGQHVDEGALVPRGEDRLLEDLGSQAVLGYRAPSFSIGYSNPWAFDVLLESGTLRNHAAAVLADAYAEARRQAADETEQDSSTFPATDGRGLDELLAEPDAE